MMMFFLLPLIFITLGITNLFRNNVYTGHKRNSRKSRKNPSEQESNNQKNDILTSKIFKLAAKNQGKITLSDIVIETGLNIKEAEKLMDKLVDDTHIRMEVDKQGFIIYEFPEIIFRQDRYKSIEGNHPEE